MTAAECKNPQRILPLATKIVFFRIAVFYVLALFLLGLVVPADDHRLAASGEGAKYSPFQLAADLANIKGIGHFFNATIVMALVSMANVSIFAASRALQALCAKGMGPGCLAKVTDKRGVPLWATWATFGFGLVGFISCAPGGEVLFDWLMSLAATFNFYTWIAISVTHIRFRSAWKAQGRDLNDLLYQSPFGVWGSWVALAVMIFGLCANVATGIWPVHGQGSVTTIFRENLGNLIPLPFFVGYQAWQYFCGEKMEDGSRRMPKLLIPSMEVDLVTGLRDKHQRVPEDSA